MKCTSRWNLLPDLWRWAYFNLSTSRGRYPASNGDKSSAHPSICRQYHGMIKPHSKSKFDDARSQNYCSSLSFGLRAGDEHTSNTKSASSFCKRCSSYSSMSRKLSCVKPTAELSVLLSKCFTQNSIGSYSTYMKDIDAKHLTPLHGEVDSYKGIWINLSQMKTKLAADEFEALLKASLSCWRQAGLQYVWLQVAMKQGEYVTLAAQNGFSFHHAEGQLATLVLSLDASKWNRLPRFASHQMGVSGVVINEKTKEVLAVQDKGRRYRLWKFPGGLSDLGEDIATTAEREVFEETGLKTEFQSVLAFRQQHDHPGAFGRSDIYILCRLKPLTFDLKRCEEEISACQWMSVERLKSEVQATSITHHVAALVDTGLTQGWDKVDICSTKMASIYKGKTFHLFHRPLS